MIRHFKIALAAASLVLVATPLAAQDAPEEPRTTYQLNFLKFAPDGSDRWTEIMEKNLIPARAAAGLPPVQVHWVIDGQWDIMLVMPMPRGMAQLDVHNSPERKAFMAALEKQLGSKEAAEALFKDLDKTVSQSMRLYSHTHP